MSSSPYLQVDLDALDKAQDVAQCAGVPVGSIVHGLLRLWRWAWAEKQDRLKPAHVRGFFGGDEARVSEALEAFGFIEAMTDGTVRVRGATRYLRISEARSAGGHAAKNNLKRGKVRATAAGSQPESSRDDSFGSTPALTSSIEHRASKALKEEEAPRLTPGSLPAAAGDQPECSRVVAGSQPETSREVPRTPPAPLPPTPSVERQAPQALLVRPLDLENPHDAHWRRLQEVREAEGYARDLQPPPRHEVAKYSSGIMLALNGDEERALESYAAWLREPWVRQRNGPWRLWLKQWPEKLKPATQQRERVEAPCCARCGEASIGQAWGTDVCAGCNAEWSASDGEGEAGFRAWLGRRPALRAVGGGA